MQATLYNILIEVCYEQTIPVASMTRRDSKGFVKAKEENKHGHKESE